MTYRIDHAVYAVRDLDVAAGRWRERYGLEAAPGGRHARWGTANRIVPLGDDYLELISVVDPEVAAGSVLGRRLGAVAAHGDAWFALCLADDDLDATASRLGLEVETGSRTLPDGTELRWRHAGIDADEREPWLPFFIAWEVPPELHPGRSPSGSAGEVHGIAGAKVAGDPERMRDWLGGAEVAIDVVPIGVASGEPGIVSATLRRTGGDDLVVP